MLIETVGDDLKKMALNGVTLPQEEKMLINLAAVQLKAELNLEECYLWGKIEGKLPQTNNNNAGVLTDYYIAVGVNYLGAQDFPVRQFFWCTTANMTFSALPAPLLDTCKPIFDSM